MARLTRLIFFQFRAYNRSLGVNPLSRAEKMLVSWAAVAMVMRYAANCVFAGSWMGPERAYLGRQMVFFNLLYIFVFWLVIPFLLSGTNPASRRTSLGRFLSLPLSRGRLFLLTLSNIVVRPVYTLLFVLTLAGLIPVFIALPAPGVAAAGILFTLFCLAASVCVSLAGEAAVRGRLVRHILRLAVPGTMILAIALNVSFLVSDRGLHLVAATEKLLWYGTGGTEAGWSRLFIHWSPAYWAVRALDPAGGLPWLGVLTAGIAGCLVTAWLLFRRSLAQAPVTMFAPEAGGQSRKKERVLLSALGLKEQRYALRSGDPWMGLAVSLFFTAQIVLSRSMSERIFIVLLPLVFLLNAAAAFNSFGLDGAAGFGRYLLSPLGFTRVVRAKNMSFISVMGIQAAPIILSSLWRFGGLTGLRAIINYLLALIAIIISGNFLSLYMAVPRKWRGFVTFGQSGGIFAAGIIVGIWWLLFWLDGQLELVPVLLLKSAALAGLAVFYVKLLPYWQKNAGKRCERIRESLLS